MKQYMWLLLSVFALTTVFTSCKDEDNLGVMEPPTPEVTTYMGLNLRISDGSNTRAADDDIYNYYGTYEGMDDFTSIDVYVMTADGSALLTGQRFTTGTFAPANGGQSLRLSVPFKATPGPVQVTVILNSPNPVLNTVLSDDWMYTKLYSNGRSVPQVLYGGGTTAGAIWAYTTDVQGYSTGSMTFPIGTPFFIDHMVLIGRNTNFSIKEGVTSEMVQTGENVVPITVSRLPARAFLTTTAPQEVKDKTGKLLGTISNLTFSVAQTANASYLYPKTVGDITPEAANATTSYSWGYDFVPGIDGNDYNTQARTYYDYNDLLGDARPIPVKPLTADGQSIDFRQMSGVFMAETTHERGVDAASSKYKKGNTAYFLVRGTFVPDPSTIIGGKALPSDGTFYVGATDQFVYASIEDAQSPTVGMENQAVMTYPQGKVLYYLWLNPDQNPNDPNFDKPINSPVVRNNVYHANISGFSRIGYNWNPLVPSGGVNPDPKPNGPEPADPPVNPNDPLSDFNTYMSVEISVLNWGFHSYQVDL